MESYVTTIRDTSRTCGERFKEHLKEPAPIHVHSIQTGHKTMADNFSILGREDHGLARRIKESIFIRVNNPTLNRNAGKYNLHHIWDRVLSNTHGLNINNDNGHTHRTYLRMHDDCMKASLHQPARSTVKSIYKSTK